MIFLTFFFFFGAIIGTVFVSFHSQFGKKNSILLYFAIVGIVFVNYHTLFGISNFCLALSYFVVKEYLVVYSFCFNHLNV